MLLLFLCSSAQLIGVHHQSLYWPTTIADVADLYPFLEELKGLSSSYNITSNTTSASMFPTISAAVQEYVGPFFDSLNLYGASNQLASRLVPQSYIDPSNASSITAVAEAIWNGLQILNEPLRAETEGLFGPASVFMLGDMPAATSKLVNLTGANPGLYKAGWHVVYAT